MPEYRNPDAERAAGLNERARSMFEAGTAARETGERYVRQTVLFATVLFLVAIAQRFRFRWGAHRRVRGGRRADDRRAPRDGLAREALG
jgi:hypothetical protein